jgi:4-hydroxybutyrate CoA-transferase
MADGAAVTTMRADVDYVVTEHGVAHLKGKALRERAFALLDIADPAFRDQIVDELKALKGDGWLARRATP